MRIARRALIVLVGLTLGFGTGASATAASRAQSTGSAPVTLVAPAGWFTSADGKVVAQAEADLSAAVPAGPRAQVIKVRRAKQGVSPLTKRITAAEGSDPELVDGPTDVTLGSGSLTGTVITFSVTVRGERLVQRYVIVNPPDGEPSLILLEAPEAQWAGAVDTLMTTLTE